MHPKKCTQLFLRQKQVLFIHLNALHYVVLFFSFFYLHNLNDIQITPNHFKKL